MSDFIGQSVVVMVTIQNIKNQYERAICHLLQRTLLVTRCLFASLLLSLV